MMEGLKHDDVIGSSPGSRAEAPSLSWTELADEESMLNEAPTKEYCLLIHNLGDLRNNMEKTILLISCSVQV